MSWFRVVPDKSGAVTIGRYKEQLVREVAFPLPELGEGGRYQAKLQRPHDEAPYPLASRVEGRELIWLVGLEDTSDPGEGLVEIRWDGPNGETWKSPQYAVRIAKGLADPKEAPEAWAGFMQQVNRDAGRAESAAGRAEALEKGYTEALEKARAAAEDAWQGKVSAEKSAEAAQEAATSAGAAADRAAESKGQAETARTGAEAAQTKAEEAAQGVAADREQIGANKSGLEAAQQELTATKEQLAETKATLATTNEDLKKAQRAIKFQAELNKGQTWDFEEDTQEAYQRQVPSGAKAGAVMAVGGKTVAWNQLCQNAELASLDGFIEASLTVLTVADGIITANCKGPNPGVKSSDDNCIATINHYYYIATTAKIEAGTRYYAPYCDSTVFNVDPRANGTGDFVRSSVIAKAITPGPAKIGSRIATTDSGYYEGVLQMKQPVFIDLTLLYGPGNEPTDISDPRIAQIEAYAAAHPAYNAGELLSALVGEVRVVGKNLVSAYVGNRTSKGVEIKGNGDGTYTVNGTASGGMAAFESGKFKLVKGKQYKIIGSPPSGSLSTYYSYIRNAGGWAQYFSESGGRVFTAAYDEYIIGFNVKAGIAANNIIWRPMVTEKTDATYEDYSPYREELLPIPSAVQALPGYGWSAGNVANTVERTENGWQYVQRVGSVDLGTLRWEYSASKLLFSANIDGAVDTGNTGYTKLECAVLMPGKAFCGNTTDGDGEITINHGIAVARKMAYDNVEDFTSYVSGHPLYYELATPITTDITALMGDSLAPFPVESGGSITLHHPKADEGFTLDVPGKIQYITKLSEVSANG